MMFFIHRNSCSTKHPRGVELREFLIEHFDDLLVFDERRLDLAIGSLEHVVDDLNKKYPRLGAWEVRRVTTLTAEAHFLLYVMKTKCNGVSNDCIAMITVYQVKSVLDGSDESKCDRSSK